MRLEGARDERRGHSEAAGARQQSAGHGCLDAAPVLLRELLELSVDLARRAGRLHVARAEDELRVETKSSITDLVSEVDREAEQSIVARLAQARPKDAVLAEEGTLRPGSSGVRWVIDPLDGTVNYLHAYPAYAVSIAVEVDGKPEIGTVYDSSTGRCYTALSGFGAICDGRPIHVRHETDLARSLVATGFSYDADQRERQAEVLRVVLGHVSDIRRSGSAALDLCHVAAGHVDGYWELDNGPWDYGAGSVIAGEAGAEVVLVPAAHGRGPAVVAANSDLLPALVALLKEAGALA